MRRRRQASSRSGSDGKTIDAVAQATKHGYVFVFDRATGTPIFPIEYRKVPASDVPGEVAADTQPIPTKPAPFARQALTPETDHLANAGSTGVGARRTREVPQRRPVRAALGRPADGDLSRDSTAAPEWGGQAFDPDTGLLLCQRQRPRVDRRPGASRRGQLPARGIYQQNCAACHRDDLQGAPPQIASLVGIAQRKTKAEISAIVEKGAGRMPGFPYLSAAARAAVVDFLSDGTDRPAAAAPGATADAAARPVSLHRLPQVPRSRWLPGRRAAVGHAERHQPATRASSPGEIPLGEYPELAAKGLTNTGTENYGGPIVTAGGLVFIGATNFDRKFRAFDKATGALLWETTLPFSGNGTPATYEVDGRQYVAIAAGGGKGGARQDAGSCIWRRLRCVYARVANRPPVGS